MMNLQELSPQILMSGLIGAGVGVATATGVAMVKRHQATKAHAAKLSEIDAVFQEKLRPYTEIVDVDAELAKRQGEIKNLLGDLERLNTEKFRAELEAGEAAQVLLGLQARAFAVEELHLTPEAALRASEKDVLAAEKAWRTVKRFSFTQTTGDWLVNDSLKTGRRMQTEVGKLVSEVVDAYIDHAAKDVTDRNIDAKVTKLHKQLDKVLSTARVWAKVDTWNDEAEVYIEKKLRLKAALLKNERARKAVEQEQKRQIREEQRREKEQRQLVKDLEKAEREEQKQAELLARARQEAIEATGHNLELLTQRIADMEAALASQHARNERARSMAQLTRAGYVYVISNIGSFGEQVYKIGMTRRLVPEDRVKELGDASVPFSFDTHALIYSSDAPALETALHQAFEVRRVNKVNGRKEFFRVTLDEIVEQIRAEGVDAEITETAAAAEFRETKRLEALAEKATALRLVA